jgi:hypothetical protein
MLAGGAVSAPGRRPTVGDSVVLTPDYASHSDAAGGPLHPGETGVIEKDDGSDKPFHIRANGRTWWYKAEAVMLAGGAAGAVPLAVPAGPPVLLPLHPHDVTAVTGTRRDTHTCDVCRRDGSISRCCASCDWVSAASFVVIAVGLLPLGTVSSMPRLLFSSPCNEHRCSQVAHLPLLPPLLPSPPPLPSSPSPRPLPLVPSPSAPTSSCFRRTSATLALRRCVVHVPFSVLVGCQRYPSTALRACSAFARVSCGRPCISSRKPSFRP